MREVYNQDALPDITLPTRCFSCNKAIGDMEFRWLDELKKMDKKEKNVNKIIMENLGLKRFCCRSIICSHMEKVLEKKLD